MPQKRRLALRIGFAFKVDEKTVIRGGWGNFFGVSPQQATSTVGPFGFRTQYNWVNSLDGITPYNLFSDPFPQGFGNPAGSAGGLLTQAGSNLQAPVQETLTPYSMQWNLNIQRELPGRFLLEVGYVGTHGFQLMRNDESGLDLNQLDPRYMALGSSLNDLVPNPFFGLVTDGVLATQQVSRMQLLRPYPQFTNIIPLYSSGSSSTYNALQVAFSKRYSHGLQLEGSYTWSKTLDNGMSHQNSYDILASRAVTDFDRTHRFVVSYIYELPFGKGRHFGSSAPAAVNWLLGGWQFNAVQGVLAARESPRPVPRRVAEHHQPGAVLEPQHERDLHQFRSDHSPVQLASADAARAEDPVLIRHVENYEVVRLHGAGIGRMRVRRDAAPDDVQRPLPRFG